MIDHCIVFLRTRQENRLYRAYVTDLLRVQAEILAAYTGAEINAKDFKVVAGWVKRDERSGDEIAADIIKRAGLRMNEE